MIIFIASGELIIICLELVKTRLSVMSAENRKVLIQNVMAQLIEKSQDGKVLKTITKLLDEWLRVSGTGFYRFCTGVREIVVRPVNKFLRELKNLPTLFLQ